MNLGNMIHNLSETLQFKNTIGYRVSSSKLLLFFVTYVSDGQLVIALSRSTLIFHLFCFIPLTHKAKPQLTMVQTPLLFCESSISIVIFFYQNTACLVIKMNQIILLFS